MQNPAESPRTGDVTDAGTGRRSFLKLSGVGLSAAALVAACGNKKTGTTPPLKTSHTGTTQPTSSDAPPATVSPTDPTQLVKKADREADLVVLRTATSMEFAAAAAYDLIQTTPLDGGAKFNALVPRLKAQHAAAAKELQTQTKAYAVAIKKDDPNQDFTALDPEKAVYVPGKIKASDGTTDDNGNAYLWANFVQARVRALLRATPASSSSDSSSSDSSSSDSSSSAPIDDPNGIVKMARDLENICTSTYVQNAGIMSQTILRVTTANLAAVESRAAAVLSLLMTPPDPPAPDPTFNFRNSLGTAGALTFDGSVAAAGK